MRKQKNDKKTKTLILNTSKELFITQGYEKTTIRQIITKAGVTTGSLYHFFTNKEDILLSIIKDYFIEIINQSTKYATEYNEPLLIFPLDVFINFHLLKKYKNLAELYLTVYNSILASNFIIETTSTMTSKWFDEYTPSFTQSDYYNRSVLMKGMFHSFICEQFSNDKVLLDERIQLIIHTTFSLFNIPNIKTEKVIIEAKNIIIEKNINIFEYQI